MNNAKNINTNPIGHLQEERLKINLSSGQIIEGVLSSLTEMKLDFFLKKNTEFFDLLMNGAYIESGTLLIDKGEFPFGHCEVTSITDHSIEYRKITIILVEASLPPRVEILEHIRSLNQQHKIPIIRPSLIHSGRRRRKQRLQVSKGEFIYAYLYTGHTGQEKIKTDVCDISVTGLSILLPRNIKFVAENLIMKKLKLRLFLTTLSQYDITCQVRHVTNHAKGNKKIGLKIIDDSFHLVNKNNTYNFHPMANLPRRNPIIGTMYKKRLYKEKVAIKLLALSKEYARILVYDLEIILLPGIEIQASFYLGTNSNKPLVGRITRVLSITKHEVIFEIKIQKFPKPMEKNIVEHCLLNFNWSPNYLRTFDLECQKFSDVFRVRPIKYQEEYIEVLKLRFETYKAANKVSKNTNFTNMISEVDKISKIIGVFHHNTLVGSVTLTMPTREDIILDTERPLKNGYPKKFPKKTNLIEISRLCTHKNYRKGDLILRLIEHMYKELAISKRDYMISSTEAKLWPLYKGIGMKKTGLGYEHPNLDNIWHDIIILHKYSAQWGKGMSYFRWNYLYRSMGEHIYEYCDIPRSTVYKIWLKSYGLFFDKIIFILKFFGLKLP